MYSWDGCLVDAGSAKNFPGTENMINAVAATCSDFVQVISSRTEENLIEEWAIRQGLSRSFFRIYGREHGTKSEHIALIRQTFPEAQIVFISSSAEDMSLPADICIGLRADGEIERFLEAGADAVLSGSISSEGIMMAFHDVMCPCETM